MKRPFARQLSRGTRVRSHSSRDRAGWAVIGLLLVLLLAACQRPTQALPPSPVFRMEAEENRSEGMSPLASVRARAFYSGPATVYFEHDRSDLSEEGRAVLDRLAAWLLDHPEVHVSLQGHADESGTRAYCFALGEQRAAAMRFYLSAKGIVGTRLSVTSFGKERLASAAPGEAGARLNRRGEAVLTDITEGNANP